METSEKLQLATVAVLVVIAGLIGALVLRGDKPPVVNVAAPVVTVPEIKIPEIRVPEIKVPAAVIPAVDPKVAAVAHLADLETIASILDKDHASTFADKLAIEARTQNNKSLPEDPEDLKEDERQLLNIKRQAEAIGKLIVETYRTLGVERTPPGATRGSM